MNVDVDTNGSVAGLKTSIDSSMAKGSTILLILSADANGFSPDSLDPVLKQARAPLFGGLFPFLLHQSAVLARGIIVIGFASEVTVLTLTDISAPELRFEDESVSRMLFMKEAFDEELASVVSPNVPFVETPTLGETANTDNDHLECYNKTAVVTQLAES